MKEGEKSSMPNMYCPICEKIHFVVQRIRVNKFIYKGHILKCQERLYMCRNTLKGAEFFEDGEMVNENLAKKRAAIEEFENDC